VYSINNYCVAFITRKNEIHSVSRSMMCPKSGLFSTNYWVGGKGYRLQRRERIIVLKSNSYKLIVYTTAACSE